MVSFLRQIITGIKNTTPGAKHGSCNGAPCGIRTHGLLIRSQTLYPAELRVHVSLETCRIIAPLRGFVNHKLKDSAGYNSELFDYFGVFVPKVFQPKVT